MEAKLKSKFVLFLVIALLLVSGCVQTSPTIPAITEDPFPLPKPSQTIGLPTQTPFAASPTTVSTKTPTVIPSFTPLPTLRAEEAQQEIARLMQTNSSCSGVCFWGLEPGITRLKPALQTFRAMGKKGLRDGSGNYQLSFHYEQKNIFVDLRFSEENEIIQSMRATMVGLGVQGVIGEDWLAFRPDGFLKMHGAPDRVNIRMSEGPEGRLSYEMIFVNNDMVIQYSGIPVVTKPKTTLRACPLEDHSIDRFDVWMGEVDYESKNKGVEIERVSAMTAESLYQTLIGDPGSACFDLDYDKYLSQ